MLAGTIFCGKWLRKGKKILKKAYSGVGPHRDDEELYLNNKRLKSFGFVGECRISSLRLKLAESEIVTEKNNLSSIALIDDVSGELDAKTMFYA